MNRIVHLACCLPRLCAFIAFLLISIPGAYSQSCDCPAITTCGPCQGGLTSITIRYEGSLPVALVTATDGGPSLVLGPTLMAPGDVVTINSLSQSQKFTGDAVTISIAGIPEATINTSCSAIPYLNDKYGSFKITGGSSKQGGTLCCEPADMETDPPVLTNCPGNIQLTLPANSCTIPVTWTDPQVTDNCGVVTLSSSRASGSLFTAGTTQVTYTATDKYGNTSTCSFNVTILDNTNPVFTSCPANITQNVSAGCKQAVTWVAPTATDNGCAITSITSNYPSGYEFPVGTTTVTYTATDALSNSATCSFTVTVNDRTAPVFTCLSDIIVNSNGACQAVVNWTAPAVTDNCDTNITVQTSHAPGSNFPLGTTQVTYTATDDDNNTSTCKFNVVVKEFVPPVFTCSTTDVIVSANASCKGVGTWSPPNAVDNCSAVTISSNYQPGHTFDLGATQVTYQATDAQGNTSTCSFNVVVRDVTPPQITGCPADITVNIASGCTRTVTWTAPQFTDNCTGATMAATHSPGSSFPIGVTTVTYTAKDVANNTTTCTFKVTVKDEVIPVFQNCPANIVVEADQDCSTPASWNAPVATDNCGSVIITSTHSPGAAFPLGVTQVTYTAKDQYNNTASCSFTVTVNDRSAPLITCPSNIQLQASTNCKAVATWSTPLVSDNCDNSVTLLSSHASGSAFPLGTTQVTYTATDNAGNSSTCVFNVSVVDTTPPVITGCPANITVNANANCSAVVNWTTPGVSEVCSYNLTTSHQPGSTFPLGVTTVTYQAVDGSGNKASCSFSVTVVDNTKPVIANCPGNIQVTAGSACNAVATWVPPTITDNCSVTSMQVSHAPGNTFAAGSTKVTYTATDAAGNSATCSFFVNVVDVSPPVVSGCPSDIVMSANYGCPPNVYWSAPSFTDNCGSVTVDASHSPGSVFQPGQTIVSYTARDNSGNTKTCSFKVIVQEASPVFVSCPMDIEVSAGNSCATAVTWTPPSLANDCGVELAASHAPGDTFPLGETEVTYTAKDRANHITVCRFKISVADRTPPVIVCNNVAEDAVTGCSAVVSWDMPIVTDNCQPIFIESDHQSGETFAVGTTKVTYTARDSQGNVSTCSMDVIVKDKKPPVFTNCPSGQRVGISSETCSQTASWSEPQATDECGEVIITSNYHSGDQFPIGETLVTYTATDAFGNTAQCQFVVIMEDEFAPQITDCPADMQVFANENGTASVSWTAPIASSVCSTVVLTASHQPGDIFPVGETEVTYVAKDALGREATCGFTVNVVMHELAIDIQKVITPDGNGVNDHWILKNIDKFQRNSVVILDRWGGVVFETSAYDNESVVWRGDNQKGNILPTGTYFYNIELEYAGQKLVKTGFIELIR